MRILSIETSCDETSLALVETTGGLRKPKFAIKKHLIASQVETHRPWGGVVPNLAKREHQIALPIIFEKIIGRNFQFPISNFQINPGSPISPILRSKNRTKCDRISDFQKIDLIAVTVGPGLEPCLWQGIEFAKTIKKEYFPKAKIVSVNHLHGHMYSFLLTPQRHPERSEGSHGILRSAQNDIFPAIQLLVSGGHTILLLMKSLTDYKKLGETRDDAAGEAFDKVARMLGLPYPGGPEIEALARSAILSKRSAPKDFIQFPRPMIHDKNYDFSFSGLKTSVLYYLKANEAKSYKLKANVAASFQNAVIDVLTAKTLRATKEYGAKSIILSGGVAANQALRNEFKKRIKTIVPERSRRATINFLSADKKFQGDNAAMIAIAGYITNLRKKKYSLTANGNLNLQT